MRKKKKKKKKHVMACFTQSAAGSAILINYTWCLSICLLIVL